MLRPRPLDLLPREVELLEKLLSLTPESSADRTILILRTISSYLEVIAHGPSADGLVARPPQKRMAELLALLGPNWSDVPVPYLYMMGLACERSGDLNRARAAYVEAAKYTRETHAGAQALYSLGLISEIAGDRARAHAEYRAARDSLGRGPVAPDAARALKDAIDARLGALGEH